MAPELFYSSGVHSMSSDLWALGAVLFELATGRPPFYDRSLEEVVRQILEEEPSPLPLADPKRLDPSAPTDTETFAAQQSTPDNPHGHTFSPAFAHFLSRCLEKEPHLRMTWPELRSHPWWNQKARGLGEWKERRHCLLGGSCRQWNCQRNPVLENCICNLLR